MVVWDVVAVGYAVDAVELCVTFVVGITAQENDQNVVYSKENLSLLDIPR